MQSTRTIFAVAAAFGLAVSAAPAVAASSGPSPMVMAQAAQTSYSDEKLESFANAAVAVREIREEHAQKIEGVTDEEKHAEIVDETIKEMTGAVEDEPGISVEEYNEINQASQSDEALAQKIQAKLQEAER